MSSLKEPHQSLILLWVELPQRMASALARKDLANQHYLDHINELDLLGGHALDAHLQRYHLIRGTPVRTLLNLGG